MDRIKLAKANELANEISRLAVMIDVIENENPEEPYIYKLSAYNKKGFNVNDLEVDKSIVVMTAKQLEERKIILEKEFESL